MTFKDKLIMVILGLLTLGIYPAVIFLKRPTEENMELTVSKDVTVNMPKLKELLGGEDNIALSEYTHTKVKIFLRDTKKANVEGIKALKGISGVFATSKYVTIIVGNQAANLAKEL